MGKMDGMGGDTIYKPTLVTSIQITTIQKEDKKLMARMDSWNNEDYHLRQGQRIAKTLVSSVRYKPTTIAIIAQYLIKNDERPRTISNVIKLSLECFRDMILAKDPSNNFTNETSAIEFLQMLGIINKDSSDQNIKRIHNNLSIESLHNTSRESEFTKGIDIKALAKEIDAKARPRDISTTPAAEQTSDPHEMVKLMAESSPSVQQTKGDNHK